MKKSFVGAVVLSTFLLASSADGAILRADYQFGNTFASSVAGAPALTPIDQGGTTGTFSSETVNGTPNVPVFTFNGNRGLIASTLGVVPNNSYSAVFYARLADVEASGVPPTTPIIKILDFKNRTSDSGQYVVGGVPTFFDGLLPTVPGTGLFMNNTYAQFALTRDAGGAVSVYLNGAPLYSFADTAGLATLDQNLLTLFADDPNTLGAPTGLTIEAAAGAIARLRLYEGALTPAEVAALDTIPEPGCMGLFGLAGIALTRRRQQSAQKRTPGRGRPGVTHVCLLCDPAESPRAFPGHRAA